MPKVISLVIILLFVLLIPKPTFAAASCISSGITYTPFEFFENNEIKLSFTLTDQAFNYIKSNGPYVRLDFGTGRFTSYQSRFVEVTSKNFSLTIDNPTLKQIGPHDGALHISKISTTNYGELCSELFYEVKKQSCTIDPSLPSKIQPNTPLIVKFVGIPDRDYEIRSVIRQPNQNPVRLGTARTGTDGQGIVTTTPINGNNGDSLTLSLRPTGTTDSSYMCFKENLILDISAAPQQPPPSGPITPNNTVQNCTSNNPNCTKASGQACPDGQTGLYTALGCVPTEPQTLIQAILRLSGGVAGGIAFLMMIVGAFQMITSAGNPDTLKAGQQRFTSAIVGLLFVIFAVLLLQIIGVDILNIPGFSR